LRNTPSRVEARPGFTTASVINVQGQNYVYPIREEVGRQLSKLGMDSSETLKSVRFVRLSTVTFPNKVVVVALTVLDVPTAIGSPQSLGKA